VALEGLYWLMAMPTKENGSRIKRMVKGPICIPTELDTRVSGSKINKKDWGAKRGLMEVSTKACITMVRNMVRANSHGKMAHLMLETGLLTRCMAMVFLGGQTAGATKGSIKTIENMEKESSSVLTEKERREFGRMGNK
jgi:hypothetical protein